MQPTSPAMGMSAWTRRSTTPSGYVQSSGASQTPQRWLYGGEGAIFLARSPAGVAVTLAPLPEALAASLDSPYPAVRIGAVNALGEWLSGAELSLALTAEQKLRQIADTDVPAVAAAARACLPSLVEPLSTERSGRDLHAEKPSTPPGSGSAAASGTGRLSLSTADTEALAVSHDVRADGNALGGAAQKDLEAVRTDRTRSARLLADAERAAQSLTDEYYKAKALADIAKALAASDPDRSARLIADAERAAQSLTVSKAEALADIAKALAASDPHRAERIAQSITDESWKARALADIAKALAASDPDRAERIAQSITDESWKARALADIAKALAASDPDRAERIAQSITDKHSKARALADIAKALAASDPDRSARVIADAERAARSINTVSKVDVLADVAVALAATDPEQAERIAQSITDDYSTEYSLAWTLATAIPGTENNRAWPLAERREGAGSIRPRRRGPAHRRRRARRPVAHRYGFEGQGIR